MFYNRTGPLHSHPLSALTRKRTRGYTLLRSRPLVRVAVDGSLGTGTDGFGMPEPRWSSSSLNRRKSCRQIPAPQTVAAGSKKLRQEVVIKRVEHCPQLEGDL
jgi:hypothetical protein